MLDAAHHMAREFGYEKTKKILDLYHRNDFKKIEKKLAESYEFAETIGKFYAKEDFEIAQQVLESTAKIEETTKLNYINSLFKSILMKGTYSLALKTAKVIIEKKEKITEEELDEIGRTHMYVDLLDDNEVKYFEKLAKAIEFQDREAYIFKDVADYLREEVSIIEGGEHFTQCAIEEKEFLKKQKTENLLPFMITIYGLNCFSETKYKKDYAGKIHKLTEKQTDKLCNACEIAYKNKKIITNDHGEDVSINYIFDFWNGLEDTLDNDYENIDKWMGAIIDGFNDVARTGRSLSEIMKYAA